MIREAISRVIMGINLSYEESCEVMKQIMEGKATASQIGSLLTALRMKGETIDEITGFAQVMRTKSLSINSKYASLVDTCGTGGDGTGTFNISTTAAFVIAGAGLPVAKHGNRSVSSQSGSADLLEALGVNTNLSPKEVEDILDKTGFGFLFAPHFHEAMKYAVGPRKEIGIRSIFNILGPLTNPARASFQIVGVYDGSLTENIAQVLDRLGVEGAYVVHGSGGLDEISTLGPTKITHLFKGNIKTFEITPEDFGFSRKKLSDIKGGDAFINAEITRRVLHGEKGPYRDIVLLNAGAAIAVTGVAKDIYEGVEIAIQSIDSGKALEKLQRFIEITNNNRSLGEIS